MKTTCKQLQYIKKQLYRERDRMREYYDKYGYTQITDINKEASNYKNKMKNIEDAATYIACAIICIRDY